MDSEPLLATGSPFLQPILNLQQPFHFFCTDSLCFATNPQQCCNNCSNSCFLSDYSTTLWREGGPFREPSGLSIIPRRTRFSFFGTVFWTHFQEPLFLQKMHFGSQKVLQNGSRINSGSDLGCHFYIFQRTLILNDPPMILTYFQGSTNHETHKKPLKTGLWNNTENHTCKTVT